jgi:23S rRNA (cytosine1962-C5)-methyltransferase
MGSAHPRVTLHPRGARRLRGSHPWIFRDDLRAPTDASHGDLVRLLAPDDRPLGYAVYSAHSKIALRVVTREDRLPDDAFWRSRLDEARRYRQRVVPRECNAWRMVFGESDGIPGLVVDRYDRHLVVQCLTASAERILPLCLDHLATLQPVDSVLARNDVSVRRLEGLPREVRQVRGQTPHAILVREGHVRYEVDPWKGQKTGAFLDQRENHQRVALYLQGRVLDGFSYQGGFALHAAREADRVLAVDSSAAALERGRAASALNGLSNVEFRQANLFEELRRLEREGERFEAVILDPPALAKSRNDLKAAERAYKEINLRAMRLLGGESILVTSSCSYNLSGDRFQEILRAAAVDAGRTVRVIEKLTQSRDHPIRLGFPESHYLKCLVLRVT